MEAYYGDYGGSSRPNEDDFPDSFGDDCSFDTSLSQAKLPAVMTASEKASAKAFQAGLTAASTTYNVRPLEQSAAPLSLDEIVLSTRLTIVSEKRLIEHGLKQEVNLIGEAYQIVLKLGMIIGTILALSGALGFRPVPMVAAAIVGAAFFLILATRRTTIRRKASFQSAEVPDDAAMWRILCAVSKNDLMIVQCRCEDLIKLSASMPEDHAGREAVTTVTRDLRGLVTAFQSAYEFADIEQRQQLTDDLIRSVESVGSYASRQHETMMRARLDAFQTHRRYINGKTVDDAGPLAA